MASRSFPVEQTIASRPFSAMALGLPPVPYFTESFRNWKRDVAFLYGAIWNTICSVFPQVSGKSLDSAIMNHNETIIQAIF